MIVRKDPEPQYGQWKQYTVEGTDDIIDVSREHATNLPNNEARVHFEIGESSTGLTKQECLDLMRAIVEVLASYDD